MLKTPELPDGFQGRGFKGGVREEAAGYVINSCTILRLVGTKVKISSIINLLVSTGLRSTFSWSAVSIWWGSVSCKNNFGTCVRPLSISFRELGVL